MLWTEGQSLGSEHSSASGGRQCAARGLILFPLLLPVSLTFHLEIDRVLLSFWLAAAGGSALEWAAHVAPCTGVSPLPSLLRTAGCRTSQGVVPVVPAPAGPGGGGPSACASGCQRCAAGRARSACAGRALECSRFPPPPRPCLPTRSGVCQPFPLLPQDLSKSPKTMKKLLPKRKPERKPSDEEFALRKSECLRGHTRLLVEGGWEAGPRVRRRGLEGGDGAFQNRRGEPVPSLRSALEDVGVGQRSPLSAGSISCAGSIPCECAPAVDTDSQRILQGVKRCSHRNLLHDWSSW